MSALNITVKHHFYSAGLHLLIKPGIRECIAKIQIQSEIVCGCLLVMARQVTFLQIPPLAISNGPLPCQILDSEMHNKWAMRT